MPRSPWRSLECENEATSVGARQGHSGRGGAALPFCPERREGPGRELNSTRPWAMGPLRFSSAGRRRRLQKLSAAEESQDEPLSRGAKPLPRRVSNAFRRHWQPGRRTLLVSLRALCAQFPSVSRRNSVRAEGASQRQQRSQKRLSLCSRRQEDESTNTTSSAL